MKKNLIMLTFFYLSSSAEAADCPSLQRLKTALAGVGSGNGAGLGMKIASRLQLPPRSVEIHNHYRYTGKELTIRGGKTADGKCHYYAPESPDPVYTITLP